MYVKGISINVSFKTLYHPEEDSQYPAEASPLRLKMR